MIRLSYAAAVALLLLVAAPSAVAASPSPAPAEAASSKTSDALPLVTPPPPDAVPKGMPTPTEKPPAGAPPPSEMQVLAHRGGWVVAGVLTLFTLGLLGYFAKLIYNGGTVALAQHWGGFGGGLGGWEMSRSTSVLIAALGTGLLTVLVVGMLLSAANPEPRQPPAAEPAAKKGSSEK